VNKKNGKRNEKGEKIIFIQYSGTRELTRIYIKMWKYRVPIVFYGNVPMMLAFNCQILTYFWKSARVLPTLS
jgi:hypothetical protein